MPPEIRSTTSPVVAKSAPSQEAPFEFGVDSIDSGKALEAAKTQAKSKNQLLVENATSSAVTSHVPLDKTVQRLARAYKPGNATIAPKVVSKGASARKQSSVEAPDPDDTHDTAAPTDTVVANIGNTDAASPREKKAKVIVAKPSSAKTTDNVTGEAPAAEVRSAVQSASGVKTSAAAFFAARQRMAPKPIVKTTPLQARQTDEAAQGQMSTMKIVGEAVSKANIVSPVAEAAPSAPVDGSRPALGQAASFEKASAPTSKVPVKAPVPKGQGFKTGEFIVYPAHGVGQITAIEEQEVAGYKLELFVIGFVKDKMILKVPLPKIASVGMRKLAEPPVVKRALDTLTGRARVKRTMWSRRAQEYEAKINSGDLVAIAEVVRDLYRSDAQPEQSYSERQLYEAALDRMAREIAVVQKVTDSEALKLIDDQLQKGPRRTKVEETEAEDGDETEEGMIVAA